MDVETEDHIDNDSMNENAGNKKFDDSVQASKQTESEDQPHSLPTESNFVPFNSPIEQNSYVAILPDKNSILDEVSKTLANLYCGDGEGTQSLTEEKFLNENQTCLRTMYQNGASVQNSDNFFPNLFQNTSSQIENSIQNPLSNMFVPVCSQDPTSQSAKPDLQIQVSVNMTDKHRDSPNINIVETAIPFVEVKSQHADPISNQPVPDLASPCEVSRSSNPIHDVIEENDPITPTIEDTDLVLCCEGTPPLCSSQVQLHHSQEPSWSTIEQESSQISREEEELLSETCSDMNISESPPNQNLQCVSSPVCTMDEDQSNAQNQQESDDVNSHLVSEITPPEHSQKQISEVVNFEVCENANEDVNCYNDNIYKDSEIPSNCENIVTMDCTETVGMNISQEILEPNENTSTDLNMLGVETVTQCNDVPESLSQSSPENLSPELYESEEMNNGQKCDISDNCEHSVHTCTVEKRLSQNIDGSSQVKFACKLDLQPVPSDDLIDHESSDIRDVPCDQSDQGLSVVSSEQIIDIDMPNLPTSEDDTLDLCSDDSKKIVPATNIESCNILENSLKPDYELQNFHDNQQLPDGNETLMSVQCKNVSAIDDPSVSSNNNQYMKQYPDVNKNDMCMENMTRMNSDSHYMNSSTDTEVISIDLEAGKANEARSDIISCQDNLLKETNNSEKDKNSVSSISSQNDREDTNCHSDLPTQTYAPDSSKNDMDALSIQLSQNSICENQQNEHVSPTMQVLDQENKNFHQMEKESLHLLHGSIDSNVCDENTNVNNEEDVSLKEESSMGCNDQSSQSAPIKEQQLGHLDSNVPLSQGKREQEKDDKRISDSKMNSEKGQSPTLNISSQDMFDKNDNENEPLNNQQMLHPNIISDETDLPCLQEKCDIVESDRNETLDEKSDLQGYVIEDVSSVETMCVAEAVHPEMSYDTPCHTESQHGARTNAMNDVHTSQSVRNDNVMDLHGDISQELLGESVPLSHNEVNTEKLRNSPKITTSDNYEEDVSNYRNHVAFVEESVVPSQKVHVMNRDVGNGKDISSEATSNEKAYHRYDQYEDGQVMCTQQFSASVSQTHIADYFAENRSSNDMHFNTSVNTEDQIDTASLDHTVPCMPTDEPTFEEENDVTMYDDSSPGLVKEKASSLDSSHSCFKWKYAPSLCLDDLPPQTPDTTEDTLVAVLPIKTCTRPIRVGLSKKYRSRPLHGKKIKQPYN